MGRPRRRPGRSGGDRRRRRTRPVRLVAHPLRDGGRQRAVGGRCPRAGLDHRVDSLGGRPPTGLVRHRNPASWSTRPNWSSATTTPWWSACGIREFVDDGAIDPDHASPLLVSVFLDKDFAFVVSSEADARALRRIRPRAHGHPAGARLQRLAGHPQGRHRDSGAAQDQAVADRWRPDPDRVRPDGVGHQPRHGELHRPGGGVEHRRDRRRIPVRRLQPGRSDAVCAPEPGGQHPGHRYGRHARRCRPCTTATCWAGTSRTTSSRKCCRMLLPRMWFSPTSAAMAR